MPHFPPPPKPVKSEALIAAEHEGKQKLFAYFRGGIGRQTETANKTGLFPSQLSRMARDERVPISMEAAILIEVASHGELQAEVLCPSKAEVLARYKALALAECKARRAAKTKDAA
jgi:DNA-binding transcriptional regulator YdaS (Cro superfamily)